jgi:hypothetical protein
MTYYRAAQHVLAAEASFFSSRLSWRYDHCHRPQVNMTGSDITRLETLVGVSPDRG